MLIQCLIFLFILLTATGYSDSKDNNISIQSGYFLRSRKGNDDFLGAKHRTIKNNLTNLTLDYTSNFYKDLIGADFNLFFAGTFKETHCSEAAFCSKSSSSIWAGNDTSGMKIGKALIKLQHTTSTAKIKIRYGYDQINLAGLATNWGFLIPGSYRGIQSQLLMDKLSINLAWVDRYSPPWSSESHRFKTKSGAEIKYIFSAGISYLPAEGIYTEFNVTHSKDYMNRIFGKLGYIKNTYFAVIDSNYQVYAYTKGGSLWEKDLKPNTHDGWPYVLGKKISHQHVISINMKWENSFTSKFEFITTNIDRPDETNDHAVEFIPRATYGYGTSQGRIDYWWDAVSDFNKDGEKASYLSLTYDMTQLNLNGLSVGVTYIYAFGISGWDPQGKKDSLGKEYGYNLDLSYTLPKRILANLTTKIHYTSLKASGSGDLWKRYGLYNVDDIKFMLIYTLDKF
jgi:hypothetical protein